MLPTFEPVSIERQDQYNKMLVACPQLMTSDYAFSNLWGWADHYGLEWTFANGLAWIRQTKPKIIYWAPVGPWNRYHWTECAMMREAGRFTRVPEFLKGVWENGYGESMQTKECREHWDYIYSIQELSELKGNKFHKKKNLLNQFKKKYVFEYNRMQEDCVEEVLEMQAEWYKWYEEKSPSDALVAENTAITRVLKEYDRISGLMGAAIRIEGKVVAYTISEPVGDSLVIHFEKGNTMFKGVYQAINQMFLQDAGGDYQFVNREQDLGDPGLRKAKMSYNPILMLKKYEAVLA